MLLVTTGPSPSGISKPRGNGPLTQGKIERWHDAPMNRIRPETDDLPGALEEAMAAFLGHQNHQRYRESLGNLTPADICFGRTATILGK